MEIAEGISKVAYEILQLSFPAGDADFFFDSLNAAKLDKGVAAGVFGRHVGRKVIQDLLFQMEAEFLVELAFSPRFVKQAAQPAHG